MTRAEAVRVLIKHNVELSKEGIFWIIGDTSLDNKTRGLIKEAIDWFKEAQTNDAN